MTRIFVILTAIGFFTSCGLDKNFQNQALGRLDSEGALGQTGSHERALPSEYDECNFKYSWKAAYFKKTTPSRKERFGNKRLLTVTPRLSLLGNRSTSLVRGTGVGTPQLSTATQKQCDEILNIFRPPYPLVFQSRLSSSFSVSSLESIGSSPIKAGKISPVFTTLELLTIPYTEIETQNVENQWMLPIMPSCETKWHVQSYDKSDGHQTFELTPPKARCEFSLQDFELELNDQEKVVIAISGFYESLEGDSQERLTMSIERIGIKRSL